MSEKKQFRKQFLEEKRMIGSILPSSRFLTKKIINQIDFTKKQLIVELGPGTGVFTHQIIRRMSSDSVLLVFELNEFFYRHLSQQISDPRVHLIHDSAEHISFYLQQLEVEQPDVIISSLPLSAFKKDIRTFILRQVQKSLKISGIFIQFQYSLHTFVELKKLYTSVHIRYVLFNFPPAFIYVCHNKKSINE